MILKSFEIEKIDIKKIIIYFMVKTQVLKRK